MPPAGFRRSRALWDEARRPREKKMDEYKNLLRAILYEIQPIRFSQYCYSSTNFNFNKLVIKDYFQKTIIPALNKIWLFGIEIVLPTFWNILRNMTMKQWLMVICVVFYYFAVKVIHELLDAGPLVLILTVLIGIFTIGLGDKKDDENNDPNQLSAYSVFNRGFQRLLGSVDVEELVNQHVGGGMMMIPPPPGGGGGGGDDDAEDNNNNNNNNRARRQQPQPANNNINESDDDEDDDDDDDEQQQQPNNNNNANRSRKSGKKARRNKNREEKVELRRQRQAAMAMGFDGTGGQEEILAMQRLE